jgi:hypothetical protein
MVLRYTGYSRDKHDVFVMFAKPQKINDLSGRAIRGRAEGPPSAPLSHFESRSRLVRKQELRDTVGQDATFTENALTRAIGLFRKSLNDDSRVPKFIETVPTAGYRFIARVTTADETSGPELSTPLELPSTATAEFQNYIDHRALVRNAPWGALAHPGLARAFAMQGDPTKGRAAYKDFLTIWKDGDPELATLIQAKAEYPRLQ